MQINKIIFFMCFLFTTTLGFTTCPADGFDSEGKMPFKIGFEFQESKGLCPWARSDSSVQKTSLFRILGKSSQEELWHLVVDTEDIEFVTQPFTYKESFKLEGCMQSIQDSFNLLKFLLQRTSAITFTQWVESMSTYSHKENYPFTLQLTDDFNKVKDKGLIKPSNWIPVFSPQVTIQHPLNFTISLYFSLFGFKSPQMLSFQAALPLKDEIKKLKLEGCFDELLPFQDAYQSKTNGLVFLHALTLLSMAPIDEDVTDEQLLLETKTNWEESFQIDAKMRLSLMSRRPFSYVLKSLNINNYINYFKEVMSRNFEYTEIFLAPTLFNKTNYGELFLHPDGTTAISVKDFITLFEKDFLETHQAILADLINQGIITTTMLRNFKSSTQINEGITIKDLFDNYYEESLATVEKPRGRYIINCVDPAPHINFIPSEADTLSPPHFLSSTDAMGHLKEEIEEEYGEAVVEVRDIKSVGDFFCRQCNLEKNYGRFLTDPAMIQTQTKLLFNFLEKFKREETQKSFLLGIYLSIFNTVN